jgi:hypothetical protein
MHYQLSNASDTVIFLSGLAGLDGSAKILFNCSLHTKSGYLTFRFLQKVRIDPKEQE